MLGTGQIYKWAFQKATETTTWAPTALTEPTEPTEPVLLVNSIEAVADAVIAGFGIAPVPRFLIELALKKGSLKTLTAHLPARTRALIEFLVRELHGNMV